MKISNLNIENQLICIKDINALNEEKVCFKSGIYSIKSIVNSPSNKAIKIYNPSSPYGETLIDEYTLNEHFILYELNKALDLFDKRVG